MFPELCVVLQDCHLDSWFWEGGGRSDSQLARLGTNRHNSTYVVHAISNSHLIGIKVSSRPLESMPTSFVSVTPASATMNLPVFVDRIIPVWRKAPGNHLLAMNNGGRQVNDADEANIFEIDHHDQRRSDSERSEMSFL